MERGKGHLIFINPAIFKIVFKEKESAGKST